MSLSSRSFTVRIRDLYPEDDDEECVVCYSPTQVLDVQCSTCGVFVCRECLPQLQKPAECPHCRSLSRWQRFNAVGLRVQKMLLSFLNDRILGTLEEAAARLPPMGKPCGRDIISRRATEYDDCVKVAHSALNCVCSGFDCDMCEGCSSGGYDGAEFSHCNLCWDGQPTPSPVRALVKTRNVIHAILSFLVCDDEERLGDHSLPSSRPAIAPVPSPACSRDGTHSSL